MALSSSQKSVDEKATNKKVVAVLDLDECLVVIAKYLNPQDLIFQELAYIQDHIAGNYIIPPGVFEFLQYLLTKDKPSVRVCFFSAGPKERNERLVKLLLTRVFGEEHYELIKEKIAIFSFDSIEKHNGKYKKNLENVLKEGESLDSVILIDDEVQFLLPSQLQNGLIISKITYADIKKAIVPSIRHRADILENVNHMFYLTGFLEKKLFPTFLSSSDSIAKTLFQIQYEEEESLFFSLKETGFFLVSFENEDFDLLKLQKMFNHHGKPLLIKVLDKLFLFSKPDGKNLKLIALDTSLLTPEITSLFPTPNTEGMKIDRSSCGCYFYLIEKNFARIVDEMNKRKYHTAFTYNLNFELSEDPSLYLVGLTKLQEYNSELEFFGIDADKHFGLQKKEPSSSILSSIKLKYMLWNCPLPQSTPEEKDSSKNNLYKPKKVTL